MKVTLTFNLPEEQPQLDAALDGSKYQSILNDISEEIRKVLKYGTTPYFEGVEATYEQRDAVLELVRDMINEIKQDYED